MTPDINVIVAASRADHPNHEVAAEWLQSCAAPTRNADRLVIMGVAIIGFLRLVTNHRVFAVPTPVHQAMAFVDAMLDFPHASWLNERPPWTQITRLTNAWPDSTSLEGDDWPDAWIAAQVMQSDQVLASFDRSFVRLLPSKKLILLQDLQLRS